MERKQLLAGCQTKTGDPRLSLRRLPRAGTICAPTKNKHPLFKRSIKYDDVNQSLLLDYCAAEGGPWHRVEYEEAAQLTRNKTPSTRPSPTNDQDMEHTPEGDGSRAGLETAVNERKKEEDIQTEILNVDEDFVDEVLRVAPENVFDQMDDMDEGSNEDYSTESDSSGHAESENEVELKKITDDNITCTTVSEDNSAQNDFIHGLTKYNKLFSLSRKRPVSSKQD